MQNQRKLTHLDKASRTEMENETGMRVLRKSARQSGRGMRGRGAVMGRTAITRSKSPRPKLEKLTSHIAPGRKKVQTTKEENQEGNSSLQRKAEEAKEEKEGKDNDEKELNEDAISKGTVEWDDAELLKQTITRLRKGLESIDLLEEKEENVRLIKGYKKRYNELMTVEIEESDEESKEDCQADEQNEDTKMEEDVDNEEEEDSDTADMTEPNINGVKIDLKDLDQLNQALKEHQVRAEMENINEKEKSHLDSIIGYFNHRIQQLLQAKEEEIKKREETEGPSFVDYDSLNVASNRALNGGKGWDDLDLVNATILGIQLEKIKESDPVQREHMDMITDMYMIRKEKLIKELVEKDEERIRNGEITINEETNDVIFKNNHEITQETNEDTIMKQAMQNDDKTIDSEAANSMAESVNGINIFGGSSVATSKKSRKTIMTEDTNKNRKKKKTGETNHNSPMQVDSEVKKTYSNALVSKGKGNGQLRKEDGISEIRVRFQFRLKSITGKKFGEQIRPLLHDIMMCTKMIDPNTQLGPWKNTSEVAPVSGPEIPLLAESTMNDYVMAPGNPDQLTTNKTYYHYGIKIITTIPVIAFTEQWNNNKYHHKENYPCLTHVAMRPSELQASHSAYAIGYFQGSTERGEYTTIKSKLSEITQYDTEASWQIINQREVSNRTWANATAKAIEVQTNPNHKTHKRTKFKYAPSALVVHVARKEEVKESRMRLYEAYGKTCQGGQWPTMPDGSKMRFIPILRGEIEQKTTEKLYKHMETHTKLKASEEAKEIGICDIHEEKEYLNGMTLEQVIHSTTADTEMNIPVHIFKHITRKWVRDASITRYEIAYHSKLKKKAMEFLNDIENKLAEKYGDEVRNHFPWSQHRKKSSNTVTYPSIPKTIHYEDEETDRQIQNMLMKDEEDDENYANIQLEGIDFVKKTQAAREETAPQAMLIHTGDSYDSMSGISTNSKSTSGSVQWGKGVEGKERTAENVQIENKKKIINSCAKYALQEYEIMKWLKKNFPDPNDSKHKCTMNELQDQMEYSLWKDMLLTIKSERKTEYKNNQSKGEFDDPNLDRAISQVPSSELTGLNRSTDKGTSHPTNEELSHLDNHNDKQRSGSESQGQ